MAEIERRSVLELRVAGGRQLTGIAAPYGVRAHINGFDEVITQGAFRDTLADGHDVIAIVDHDPTRLLARTRNGTLRLREEPRGLSFEIDTPNTSLGNDVLELARTGSLGGMSFAFRCRPAGERWVGTTLRELRSLDLVEISTVAAWPAYTATEVAIRSRVPPRLCAAARWLQTV